MIREAIYLGHSNTIDWQLQADKEPVNLASATRMTLEVDGKVLDSDILGGNGVGNAFNWTVGTPAEGEANLIMMLGVAASAAAVVTGVSTMKLTVYDPDNPNGAVWVSSEPVLVV